MNSVFTKTTLPSGKECTILELKGRHVFNAINFAGDSKTKIIQFILQQILLIEGVSIEFSDLEELPGKDILFLYEVIEVQLR